MINSLLNIAGQDAKRIDFLTRYAYEHTISCWLAFVTWERQDLVDYSLCHQNDSCQNHHFQVGDQVLELLPTPNKKVGTFTKGAFWIMQVHSNGPVTTQCAHELQEWWTIRKVGPFLQAYSFWFCSLPLEGKSAISCYVYTLLVPCEWVSKSVR